MVSPVVYLAALGAEQAATLGILSLIPTPFTLLMGQLVPLISQQRQENSHRLIPRLSELCQHSRGYSTTKGR
jgi:hypothetical protein